MWNLKPSDTTTKVASALPLLSVFLRKYRVLVTPGDLTCVSSPCVARRPVCAVDQQRQLLPGVSGQRDHWGGAGLRHHQSGEVLWSLESSLQHPFFLKGGPRSLCPPRFPGVVSAATLSVAKQVRVILPPDVFLSPRCCAPSGTSARSSGENRRTPWRHCFAYF